MKDKPERTQLFIRLDVTMRKRIDAVASAMGLSASAWTRMVAMERLKADERDCGLLDGAQ